MASSSLRPAKYDKARDPKEQGMSSDFEKAAQIALERAVAFRRRAEAAAAPGPTADYADLKARFDVGLPDEGRPGEDVIAALADAAEPGLVGNVFPNHFGWVMGGSHPVGVAADWLTSAWGQNSGIYPTAPASAVAEEVVSGWLLDLLDLPRQSSVGFVSGATMAGFTALAAARTEVLHRAGWDLEHKGLFGAPAIDVFLGEEAHSTIFSALRYLGFGDAALTRLPVDEEGRMDVSVLAEKVAASSAPKIIICQAGHINSGAFDDFARICQIAREANAWVHVDGAFGLWARASKRQASLCTSVDEADSWSVDGHKWLQVPYDAGYAIVKHPRAHARAMDVSASYLETTNEEARKPSQFVPELSRRARGFAAWATLQALGRRGVEDMVDRHCDAAAYFADLMSSCEGVFVLNDVVLNQVALAFAAGAPLDVRNEATDRVVEALREENTSFIVGAAWKGQRIMRVSVISNETARADLDRLAHSTVTAWQRIRGELTGPGSQV